MSNEFLRKAGALLVVLVLLGACGADVPLTIPAPTAGAMPTATGAAPATTAPLTTRAAATAASATATTAPAKATTVQVYFGNANPNPTEVFAVNRTTTRSDVATFVMEEYLKGPSAEEKGRGLTSDLTLSGPSSCQGKDFLLTISQQTAILKFCKAIKESDNPLQQRALIAIEKNLTQFPTVKWFVIGDNTEGCWKSSSSLSGCLEPVLAAGQPRPIPAGEAEKIIAARDRQAIQALKAKNMAALAELAHPDKGVRFTPFSNVKEGDLVFSAAQLKSLLSDKKKYNWGQAPGQPIELAFEEYYQRYIYSHDFAEAPVVAYNTPLSIGSVIDNAYSFYPGSIIVSHYFRGFDTKFEGLDWHSLRLVYMPKNNVWYLVGAINDEWTP